MVTLRRPAHHQEGGQEAPVGLQEPRKHDHRWMVTGHWRLQPCGPHRSLRELRWVRPHIKGPEDAPLKAPHVVKALVR